jgi:hypothetical protein
VVLVVEVVAGASEVVGANEVEVASLDVSSFELQPEITAVEMTNPRTTDEIVV